VILYVHLFRNSTICDFLLNYKFVTVGYIPSDENTDLTTGETLLFEGPLAAGFEQLIAGAAVIKTAVPYKYGQASADDWDKIISGSKSREQIITQSGVKDPYAAEFLARFYGYVESSSWDNLENSLDEDLVWEVDDIPAFNTPSSYFIPSQSSRSLFMASLRTWRSQFSTVGVNFRVHWANVSSERAIMEFAYDSLVPVDGPVVRLTQYEYERQPNGYVITAIYNHSMKPVPLFSPESLPTPVE
jgi:hypothetical protein